MTYFYGHLFAIAPGIRALFPASMHAQRQRLYSALCAMAGQAEDGTAEDSTVEAEAAAGPPAEVSADEQALAALGRAHRRFGVRPEHYAPFRAALLATGRHRVPL